MNASRWRGGSAFSLLVSTAPDRSDPAGLEGAPLAGPVFVFVAPATGIARVRFFVDDPRMTGAPRQTENSAPWDLAGTASGGPANPFDTTALTDGPHVVTAAIQLSSGASTVISSTFTVENATAASPAPPVGLRMAALVGPSSAPAGMMAAPR